MRARLHRHTCIDEGAEYFQRNVLVIKGDNVDFAGKSMNKGRVSVIPHHAGSDAS
jgi:glutamate synthase domain-containing protein 3